MSQPATGDAVAPNDPVVAKAARRIVPYLFVLYFFSYIDRLNISFAALQMNADLEFSSTNYGLGAGLFFVGYVCFQVPSILAAAKYGPRAWIAWTMMAWGLISA